jgi:chemotaxis protein CheC
MSDDFKLSELEIDALKEMMNIGFGRAAASLSEIMEVNVMLTVPAINLIGTGEIVPFIRTQVDGDTAYSLVTQFFLGRFAGMSLLFMPKDEGENLINLFCATPLENLRADEREVIDRETIMEIGNILIGACVGMVSELMNNHVTFRPPQYMSGIVDKLDLEDQLRDSGNLALVFKTLFHFERQNIQGNLFVITTNESIDWLKTAIDDFLAELR